MCYGIKQNGFLRKMLLNKMKDEGYVDEKNLNYIEIFFLENVIYFKWI